MLKKNCSLTRQSEKISFKKNTHNLGNEAIPLVIKN